MYKKRILFCNEFSGLNTGFSNIGKYIVNYLYNTNKYEIAEYASYVNQNDPRIFQYPWKIYSAIPDKNSPLYQRYASDIYGQFGKTLFEHVLLDFKPDIVMDIRDIWMSSEFELKSPFRKYFKYILMPTIDGEPQKQEWISDYRDTDMLLTYSEYGKNLLNKQCPDVKVHDVVRPAVDVNLFKPLNKKKEIREKLRIPNNSHVILTVMRNQKRKLFPNLIDAFRILLDTANKNHIKDKDNIYLYLHTSYPDVGFDLSSHILRNKVSHRVLCTYVCKNCNAFFTSRFEGELTRCRNCQYLSAHMPNTNHGVTQDQLCEIYNASDLYVQYSCCEGLGMPIAEAKACGIPSMGPDYSATAEQVNNVYGCWPIKIGKIFYESVTETEQMRILPDDKDFAEKAYEFIKTSNVEKLKMSDSVCKDARDNYSLERSAKIFEKSIDSCDILDRNNTWNNNNPKLISIPKEIPNFKFDDNHLFIDWCIDNIIKNPKLKNSFFKQDLLKSLNSGYIQNRSHNKSSFTKNECVELFISIAKNQNEWEMHKCNIQKPKSVIEII